MTGQGLAGPRPAASEDGILATVRRLGCLQLDPTSVVARSHLLVLASRLGPFDPADLDSLLWGRRALFEYWAHAASIVLTEDYPLHRHWMRRYASGSQPWAARSRTWMEENEPLRRHVLGKLRRSGPLRARDFEDRAVERWRSTGWTDDRNVERMLSFLWRGGEIMVAGRESGARLWDLPGRCLPPETPRRALTEAQAVRVAAERSIRALGVARPRDIERYFTRSFYPGLSRALARLERDGLVVRVRVTDAGRELPGPWLVHAEDLSRAGRLAAGEWRPRTTLLSPFDNLICDRERTELLFGFRYRIEIYVPKAKREYGYFAMPVLDGDELVARVDPVFDRRAGRLVVNAVHVEPEVPRRRAEQAVECGLDELAAFLGAVRNGGGE